MHPKFILVSEPKTPLVGTFVYGMYEWFFRNLPN